jgi:hypothetical protein
VWVAPNGLVDSFGAQNKGICSQGAIGSWLFNKVENKEVPIPAHMGFGFKLKNLHFSRKKSA